MNRGENAFTGRSTVEFVGWCHVMIPHDPVPHDVRDMELVPFHAPDEPVANRPHGKLPRYIHASPSLAVGMDFPALE